MRLHEEYIITKSYKIWSWIIIYGLFFLCFWGHMEAMFAGGILFLYECMALVFLLRYLHQALYIHTAKILGKNVNGKPWTLNPSFWSASDYSLEEVLTLELRPIMILTGFQLAGIVIAHTVIGGGYITPVLLGTLLLSMALYNKSFKILYRCFKHGHATYKYGYEAFKVFSNQTSSDWPTSEKLIRMILKGSH